MSQDWIALLASFIYVFAAIGAAVTVTLLSSGTGGITHTA